MSFWALRRNTDDCLISIFHQNLANRVVFRESQRPGAGGDGESSPTVSPGHLLGLQVCVGGAGGVGAGRCDVNRGKAGQRAQFLLDSGTLSPQSTQAPLSHPSPLSVCLPQGLVPRGPGLGFSRGAAGGDGLGGFNSGERERSSAKRPIPSPDRVRLALWDQADHKVGRNRAHCKGG